MWCLVVQWFLVTILVVRPPNSEAHYSELSGFQLAVPSGSSTSQSASVSVGGVRTWGVRIPFSVSVRSRSEAH